MKRAPHAKRTVQRVDPALDPAVAPRGGGGEPPTHCPLFPNVMVRSVGRVIMQRIWLDEDGKEEDRVFIEDKRVNPEMDIATIKAVAGGGKFHIFMYERDRPNVLVGSRIVEIEGVPKGYGEKRDDDDDMGDGTPVIIRNADGSESVLPRLKGPAMAAYLAQKEQTDTLRKQLEAQQQGDNGMMGQILAAQMQQSTALITAMMNGGGQSSTAMLALQGQLNAANTEKATLIAQHGAALNALREEHSANMSTLRQELAKAMDECRRLTGIMEARIAEARLEERRASAEAMSKKSAEIHRLEQVVLGSEREKIRMAAESRAASETVELARLFAPRIDAVLTKVGSSGALPPELKEAVDGVKELRSALQNLPALLSGGSATQPNTDPVKTESIKPEPVNTEPAAEAQPERAASNGSMRTSVPDMPG